MSARQFLSLSTSLDCICRHFLPSSSSCPTLLVLHLHLFHPSAVFDYRQVARWSTTSAPFFSYSIAVNGILGAGVSWRRPFESSFGILLSTTLGFCALRDDFGSEIATSKGNSVFNADTESTDVGK